VLVPVLKLNAIQVLAFAAFGVLLGGWVKNRVRLFDRLNIPAPVIAGLAYALLALVVRDRYLNVEMDLVLRDILMVAFFTTVGMSASVRLIRQGGVQVVLFFALATFAAVLQNLLGISLAHIFGLNPFVGIISGSVALTGGPATASWHRRSDFRDHGGRPAGWPHRRMADPQAPFARGGPEGGSYARLDPGGAARARGAPG
jgi:ESS family glutamate:Na+ symporter